MRIVVVLLAFCLQTSAYEIKAHGADCDLREQRLELPLVLFSKDCVFGMKGLPNASLLKLELRVLHTRAMPQGDAAILYSRNAGTSYRTLKQFVMPAAQAQKVVTWTLFLPGFHSSEEAPWDVLLGGDSSIQLSPNQKLMPDSYDRYQLINGPYQLLSVRAEAVLDEDTAQITLPLEVYIYPWVPYCILLGCLCLFFYSNRDLRAVLFLSLAVPGTLLYLFLDVGSKDEALRLKAYAKSRLNQFMHERMAKFQSLETELQMQFKSDALEAEAELHTFLGSMSDAELFLPPKKSRQRCDHAVEKRLQNLHTRFGFRILLASSRSTYVCDIPHRMRLGRKIGKAYQSLLVHDSRLRFTNQVSERSQETIELISALSRSIAKGVGGSQSLVKFQNEPRRPVPLYPMGGKFDGRKAWMSWGTFRLNGEPWFLLYEMSEDRRLNDLIEAMRTQFNDHWYLGGHLTLQSRPDDKQADAILDREAAWVQLSPRTAVRLHADSEGLWMTGRLRPNLFDSYSLVLKYPAADVLHAVIAEWRMQKLSLVLLAAFVVLLAHLASLRASRVLENIRQGLEAFFEGRSHGSLPRSGHDELAHLRDAFEDLFSVQRENRLLARFLNLRARHSLDHNKTEARRIEATILFFRFKECADLEQLVTSLESYSHSCGGFVDKVMETSIMIVFEVEADSAQFTTTLNSMLDLSGFEAAGLATGPLVLGPIGASTRKDYTAIGNTVNVAARLAQIAEPVAMDSATAIRLDRGKVKNIGKVSLKGKSRQVEVYGLV